MLILVEMLFFFCVFGWIFFGCIFIMMGLCKFFCVFRIVNFFLGMVNLSVFVMNLLLLIVLWIKFIVGDLINLEINIFVGWL